MLKLIALDEEDLGVLSFHVHKARVQTGAMLWQAKQKRFLTALRRLDRPAAMGAETADKAGDKKAAETAPQTIAAVLHFDRVLAVRSYGIDRQNGAQLLSLAGLCFHKKHAPGGVIEFLFAENARLQLEVEYIEARLEDLPA